MAKKSAASKGYRKTEKKKPFLTKNEIIALAIIAALVIAAVIVVNLISTAGLIKPGRIQSGDIITVSSVDKYYKKVGTINEMEGYTLEALTSPERPTGGYTFTPVDESSSLDHLRVGGAISNASSMINFSISSIASYGLDNLTSVVEITIAGHSAYALSGTRVSTDEDGAELYRQIIYCYVDTDGEYSISLSATIEGADESVFIPEEELGDYMAQFGAAFTPIEAK